MGMRFYQGRIAQDANFRQTVLCSAMRIAYDVLTQETSGTGDQPVRRHAAITMYGDVGNNRNRLVELFTWYAVFQPAILSTVYNSETHEVTPQNIDDTVLDGIVRDFWTPASRIIEAAGG